VAQQRVQTLRRDAGLPEEATAPPTPAPDSFLARLEFALLNAHLLIAPDAGLAYERVTRGST
jgi:hypothetical protein